MRKSSKRTKAIVYMKSTSDDEENVAHEDEKSKNGGNIKSANKAPGKKGTKPAQSKKNAKRTVAQSDKGVASDDSSDDEPVLATAAKIAGSSGKSDISVSAKKTSKSDEKEEAEKEEEEEFEVKDIVAHKIHRNQILFRIRWKNFESDEDTWEPEEILSCPEIIKKYKDTYLPDTIKTTAAKKGRRSDASDMKSTKAKKPKASDAANDSDVTVFEDWEVEKIVDIHYCRNGTRDFLVRWKGCRSTDDTWEPESHLDCPDLIAKFMIKVEQSKNAPARELRPQRKRTERFSLMAQAAGRRLSRRNNGRQRPTYHDAE